MADIAGSALSGLGIILQYTVFPVALRIGYCIYFNSNFGDLEEELKRLEGKKVDVQRRVAAATRTKYQLDVAVNTWLTSVDEVHTSVHKIINDKAQLPKGCFNERCLNLKSRYVLSKKAKKKTREAFRLGEVGNFQTVGVRPARTLNVAPASMISKSRELLIDEIIRSLKDPNINIIGICGMGGVGKTTMMEEIFRRVNEDAVFEEYAKTVVSQKPDWDKISSYIAEMLDQEDQVKNPDQRASWLKQRLEGKAVLIVMDDVWKEFDLQALGITLQGGQKSCKLIYTSRNLDLWNGRQDKREVALHVLIEDEPLDLFRETVGKFLDDNDQLQTLAIDIVKECAGLPLALVTLGNALRGKSIDTWKDKLSELKTVSGIQQKGFESLKRSYDHLVNEEAKSLFLLCSLFDSEILVENLVEKGMGIQLFKRINSMEEATVRVFALVEHLSNCCLVSCLQVSAKGDRFIKIPDIIRDVSKFIASTEKGAIQHLHERKYWVENCFMVHAKEFWIVGVEDPRYWRWFDMKETSGETVSVAELKDVCWLEVQGCFAVEKLSPGTLYKVAFLVMMKDSAVGWEVPVKLKLTLPDETFQAHEEILMEKPRGQWIKIPVGEFRTSTDNSGHITFFLNEYEGGQWKRGLLIKGVTIEPKI